jgi:hypothetical protein
MAQGISRITATVGHWDAADVNSAMPFELLEEFYRMECMDDLVNYVVVTSEDVGENLKIFRSKSYCNLFGIMQKSYKVASLARQEGGLRRLYLELAESHFLQYDGVSTGSIARGELWSGRLQYEDRFYRRNRVTIPNHISEAQ